MALAFAVGATVLVARPALAETKSAEDTVKATIDSVLTILRDPQWHGADQRSERVKRLRSVADAVFDWAEMSKRSLGVHWRSIDDAQRKKFAEVFSDLLAEHYMNDIDRFRGTEIVTVLGTDEMGEDRNVKTTLTTASGEIIPIHYLLSKEKDGWHVFDVNIEGVSLVNHYRKGFSRQLANRSFDQLLDQLTKKRGRASGK